MKIFKFGGGSIQSSEAIRQLAKIVAAERPSIIVVSAMGKTTQVLERIMEKMLAHQAYAEDLESIFNYHQDVIHGLPTAVRQIAQQTLLQWQSRLTDTLQAACKAPDSDQYYSQIVAWGEIVSSSIIHQCLQGQQMACHWLDARQFIKTNKGYYNAAIDWERTRDAVEQYLRPFCVEGTFVLTQGFIGSNAQGETTTLGKEGSDFTGAILAASLSAQSLTIWKDVPGIMSGDPRHFEDTVKFDQLPYAVMLQMTLCGAKVVHPRTIEPLANHGIPLYVRPFEKPEALGTMVTHTASFDKKPIHLFLENQCLIVVHMQGGGALLEGTLQVIKQQFDAYAMPLSLLVNEDHKIVACCPHQPLRLGLLLQSLQDSYEVSYQVPVDLLTVMYPGDSMAAPPTRYGHIVFEHQSPERYHAAFRRID